MGCCALAYLCSRGSVLKIVLDMLDVSIPGYLKHGFNQFVYDSVATQSASLLL
jgi:hypothetical protein